MSLFSVVPKLASGWQNWSVRCAAESCSRRFALQAMSRKNQGISLSGNWYCGPACFEAAARDEAARLLALRAARPVRRSRMPLGLMLVSRGVINAEQLSLALDDHRSFGTRIGESLIKLGFATMEQVTAAVAAQWGCAVFPLGSRYVNTPIRLPGLLQKLCRMLPVHFVPANRKLLVGFVDAVEYGALDTIEHMMQCTTEPCFISDQEYANQLQATTSEQWHKDVAFERVENPAEIARIVCSYATQIEGEEARFGMCRDWLWARVKAERQELDLLFHSNHIQGSSELWDGGTKVGLQ